MDGAEAEAAAEADAAAAMATTGSNDGKESKATGTGVPSTELDLRASAANQGEVEADPSSTDMLIGAVAAVVMVAIHKRWRGGEWFVVFDMVCYVCMIVVHM